MHIDDVDFEYSNGYYTQKLSDLTEEEIKQINIIKDAIISEDIFDCQTKALLAAFQLYLEAQAECGLYASNGSAPH